MNLLWIELCAVTEPHYPKCGMTRHPKPKTSSITTVPASGAAKSMKVSAARITTSQESEPGSSMSLGYQTAVGFTKVRYRGPAKNVGGRLDRASLGQCLLVSASSACPQRANSAQKGQEGQGKMNKFASQLNGADMVP